jgi:FixJ family two-component response regulator
MVSIISSTRAQLGILDAVNNKVETPSNHKVAENTSAKILARQAPHAGGAKTECATVCLLDDDASVLKATNRLLDAAGWEVESFTDPEAFLRYAETQHPRVAIIDIWMPEMNGLDVQLKLKTLSPSTRVIVLTSKDHPMVRARAISAGASAFFMKGVSAEELLAAITSAASRQPK